MTDKQLLWFDVKNVLAYALVFVPFVACTVVFWHFVCKYW
jgi:hypothetical protein